MIPGVQNPHWLPPVAQGRGPATRHLGAEPVERGDRAAGHPAGRGHARHPGCAVDQHGAAAALTLGAAPVLGRAHAEVLAQHVEQADAAVGDGDRDAVDHQSQPGRGSAFPSGDGRWLVVADRRRWRGGQLKELPQPQVRLAFGLSMANPAPCRPSL